MTYAFFFGIDVAADSDDNGSVILTLVEKSQDERPSNGEAVASYRLDSISRYDAGVTPNDIADHIQEVVAKSPYTARTSIVVNCEPDPGQAIFETLRERGLSVRPVRLTSYGSDATPSGADEEANVSDRDVVRELALAHRDGRFKVQHRESDLASRLARNVHHVSALAVDGEPDPSTNVQPEDAETLPSTFDAITTSAALAVWFGSQRSFDPSSHLKEEPQTTPGPEAPITDTDS